MASPRALERGQLGLFGVIMPGPAQAARGVRSAWSVLPGARAAA